MATRATYQFKFDSQIITTVYIHHDGYCEGAAEYFQKAIDQPTTGCIATRFIRANHGAKITTGHDAHADTEYCYNIDLLCEEIEAFELNREWGKGWEHVAENPNPELIFKGSLHDFITKFLRATV